MYKKARVSQSKVVPVILSISLILIGFFSVSSIKNLQGNARVINYTGIVRGATQRLIKKELNHISDDNLINKLDEIIQSLIYGEKKSNIIQLKNNEYQTLLAQMQSSWTDIKKEIFKFRNGSHSDKLYQLSEDYFELADKTVSAAEKYTEKSVQQAMVSLIGMSFTFIFLAAIFAFLQKKRQNKLEEAEKANRRKSEQLSKIFQDIQAPMNEISELMYISDIENYELLFMNNAGREIFHVDDNCKQKCYQVLHGLNEPCPFCTTALLKPDQIYSWEHTNEFVKRHYLLKDRLIEWEGRPAKLELAFDITESENKRLELKNMLDSEKMIVECVRELYKNHDLRKATLHVLENIGKFLSVDRVYIIDFNKKIFTNTFEWCNKGITPEQDNLKNIPIDVFEQWYTLFEEQDYVIVDDMEKLKKQSPEKYKILGKQKTERLVIVPLEYDKEKNSYIGIDNPPLERIQNAVTILQTLRYFLMLASNRAKDEAELEKLSYYDTLTTFYNRNRYIQDIQYFSKKEITIGVVFVDVNGLKEINDQYGHDMGDYILKECANHIRKAFPNNAHYRIGGDEFVVFCTGISEENFYNQVNQLYLKFNENTDTLCHAAVGSDWSEKSSTIQTTIAAADEKMYADKREFYKKHQNAKRYRHHNDE